MFILEFPMTNSLKSIHTFGQMDKKKIKLNHEKCKNEKDEKEMNMKYAEKDRWKINSINKLPTTYWIWSMVMGKNDIKKK